MRCLTCQYDLRNLPPDQSDEPDVHRCPECGRIFDAADPQTFATDPFLSTQHRWCLAFGIFLAMTSPIWLPVLVLWLQGDL